MKKTALFVTLAVALCFVVGWAWTDPLNNRGAVKWLPNAWRGVALPIWQIFQAGSDRSVVWQPHSPNPRFAIYDTDGNNTTDPSTWVDDVVLDKETGLVWERSPTTTELNWYDAVIMGHAKWGGAERDGGFRP